MPSKINRFIDQCIETSMKSDCNMKHGAGLIINGQLCHTSHNYCGGNSLEPYFKNCCYCTTHAEIAAIQSGIYHNDLPYSKGRCQREEV